MSTGRVRTIVDLIPNPLLESERLIFVQSMGILVVLWYVIAHALGLAELISSPELVAVAVYELLLSGDYVPHMLDTLRRIVYAFTVSMVVGTVSGIAMGMSDFWESFLRDYVIVALAIPSLFAAVFAGMWFGLSDLTPTVAGMLIAFPFMTQNVMGGVNDLDGRLIEMSDAFSLSQYRIMRRVVVGSILPYWFSGIRYTFAICWKLTVLAEVVASESGMGFVIQRMMARFSLVGTLSYVLLFTAVIVMVEYGVFQQIEKRVFEWREETSLGFVN